LTGILGGSTVAIKKVKKLSNKMRSKKSSTKKVSKKAHVKKTKKRHAAPATGKIVRENQPESIPTSEEQLAAGTDKITSPVIGQSNRINLKESGKFWMIVISIGVVALIIIQSYGYMTGWGDSNKVMERHFNQAQRLTLAKRYQAAIKYYQKVINMKQSKDESKRQAMVGIADLYREKKEWTKAIDMYEKLQQLEDQPVMSAWSGLKIAESQVAAGEPKKALTTYKQIRERFPNSDWDAEARLGQGQAYQSLKEYDQAIEIYQALEKDYQGGFLAADALIQIGRCYERQGKKQEARKAYQYVISAYPETMADDAKRRLKRLSTGKHPLGIRHWEK